MVGRAAVVFLRRSEMPLLSDIAVVVEGAERSGEAVEDINGEVYVLV